MLAPPAERAAPFVPATTDLWDRLQAEPAAQGYRYGTRRAVPPAETLRRIRPLLARAGITRLADVTGLDWVGMPVYQAIRPQSRFLTVSQGKGLTRVHAKVSALMESLEGYHAERLDLPTVRETVGEMRRRLAYEPRELELVERGRLPDHLALDWIPATDLATGAATWVPHQLCNLDLRIAERCYVQWFWATSNGLASGNTLGEAVLHGLCEVVERDAIWHALRKPASPNRGVELNTIDARLPRRLVDRLVAAGLTVRVADLSGSVGLPCFEATLDHPDGPVLAGGWGCHPNRATALLRALTEAAQSRLAYIAGSRDDMPRHDYRAASVARAARAASLESAPARRYPDAPTLPPSSLRAELAEIVRRVQATTGMAPLAVDLVRVDFDLPVVFVIAPGLRMELL